MLPGLSNVGLEMVGDPSCTLRTLMSHEGRKWKSRSHLCQQRKRKLAGGSSFLSLLYFSKVMSPWTLSHHLQILLTLLQSPVPCSAFQLSWHCCGSLKKKEAVFLKPNMWKHHINSGALLVWKAKHQLPFFPSAEVAAINTHLSIYTRHCWQVK